MGKVNNGGLLETLKDKTQNDESEGTDYLIHKYEV